ncbi:hypothetical protein KIW84_061912 [Lathyrus oleraceus]|uniref:Uncharacterized protein n=1 Tax=Pisum sativum TaxID=3888 RepID=A0A9D4W775_PEA|nr:hypothetical protein KIW84_061912 [Pisum sativum]
MTPRTLDNPWLSKLRETSLRGDHPEEPATVKLTSRHSYNTRRNQKLLMDQWEQNQAVTREDMTVMKAQMGQLVEAIQALARGQEEMCQANLRDVAANPVVVTIPVNPPEGAGTPVVTQPPPERVLVYQNTAQTFNITINGRAQLEMDDHQDVFFTTRADSVYDAFGPSPAELEQRFRMMEDKLKAIEGQYICNVVVRAMVDPKKLYLWENPVSFFQDQDPKL